MTWFQCFAAMTHRQDVKVEEQKLEFLVNCVTEKGKSLAIRGDGWNPFGTGAFNNRATIRKMSWREIFSVY